MHFFHSHRTAPKHAPQAGYVSEFTRFMDQFLATHPDACREQRKGWRIFWDKRVDLRALDQERKDSVPTPGYYYFDPPHKGDH